MASPIYTVIDRQARTLAATLGGVAVIPPLFLYDQPIFRVQLADPPPYPGSPYTPADYTGFTMNVDLGLAPLGILGAPTSFTRGNPWDANNKWFLCAPLDLAQAATLALLLGVNSAQVYLEFSVWQAGIPQFRLQLQPTLFSPLDIGAGANPPPAGPVYPTSQEIRAGFLSKGPTTVDTKIWLSQDQTKAVLQYLDNNGVMRFDAIPVPPLPLY